MPAARVRPVLPVGTAAYRFSGALAAVTSAAAAGSFFVPGILGGPPVAQGNVRGTALVMMVVAVPTLAAAMVLTRRDSARALVVWLGALAYIGYQSVLFLFATPFNSLFPVYVAMLSLGIWSTVAVVRGLDVDAFRARFDDGLPARRIAVYVGVLALLNAAVWLRTIVPAVLSEEPAAFLDGIGATTNPVFVQDLAVWIPLIVVGAWWLWHGRRLGELVIGPMLVLLVLEAVGVASDQWFGASADPSTPFESMTAVPFFLLLAAVGAVPLAAYMAHLTTADPAADLTADPAAEPAPTRPVKTKAPGRAGA